MKKKKTLIVILTSLIIVLACVAGYLIYSYIQDSKITYPYYLASDNQNVVVYDEDLNEVIMPRGKLVNIKKKDKEINDVNYKCFTEDDNNYYVFEDVLEVNRQDCVKEETMYALRSHVLTTAYDSFKINGWVKKQDLLSVNGFHELLDDGSVDYYYVNNCGYINSKFLANEYYETGLDSSIYSDCYYGEGGDPTVIEYYNKEEINFVDNEMPDVVRALYINAEAVCAVDDYIDLARGTSINAFVVDIKDCYINTQLACDFKCYKNYAPSTYNIPNEYADYVNAIRKIKDAGFYLIGRITAFKDDSFAYDNPEEALTEGDELYEYGVYWPSIYSRKMWEYNVDLALEAVDLGFNEIQFDYSRLPENVGEADLKNIYDETRCEAITNFLRYASEYIHAKNAYVSCDVFGETSGDDINSFSCWPTSYGQFWPAMSNVVDAISSMPYPDHFSSYAYGIAEPWIDVYDLMNSWGKATYYAQANTYDPAKCRTWIQAQSSGTYDVEYTADFIADQIQGLKDADVYDGFMTWNAASSLYKYSEYIDVLN